MRRWRGRSAKRRRAVRRPWEARWFCFSLWSRVFCPAMRAPDFWTRKDFASQAVVALLTPFGWLYGASVAYRARHSHPYQAACKVLCVGNLPAGGTGKTPIAIAIAKALIARGAKPVF